MTRGEQVVGLLLAENQVAYYDEEVSNTSTALLGSVSPYDEDDLKSIRFQSKSRFYRLITQLLLAAVIGALVAAAVLTISREQLARVHTYRQLSSISRPWSKPTFPIVGVIFYGRKRNVEILDCYLKRNLVSNGGYLDRVYFMVHTNITADIEYIEQLVRTDPLYDMSSNSGVEFEWTAPWAYMRDPDTMYIKIDDDVLYMSEDAIPQLVHALEKRPDAFAMGANTVGHAEAVSWHYRNGAVLPFLPEAMDDPTRLNTTDVAPSWRTSELPLYRNGDLSDLPASYNITAPPPGNSSRWLPLPNTIRNLLRTPIGQVNTDAEAVYHSWAVVAQQHMSLFSHLGEANPEHTLTDYEAGDRDGILDMKGSRYRINVLAIWGRTVAQNPIGGKDDEWLITHSYPTSLARPYLVQTRSLVAHFSFHPQETGMELTDVRARYRAFANEKVCT